MYYHYKAQIIFLRQSEYFFDIFMARTLDNFYCNVYIECFGKVCITCLNFVNLLLPNRAVSSKRSIYNFIRIFGSNLEKSLEYT
jgi:hypothetical protein